jgi:hypothetical protein
LYRFQQSPAERKALSWIDTDAIRKKVKRAPSTSLAYLVRSPFPNERILLYAGACLSYAQTLDPIEMLQCTPYKQLQHFDREKNEIKKAAKRRQQKREAAIKKENLMNMRLLLAIAVTGWVLWGQHSLPGVAEPLTPQETKAMAARPVAATIFSHGLPPDYRTVKEGVLPEKEGQGEFIILEQAADKPTVTAVIVSVEQLGWLKTNQLKSTNPVVVAKHMLSQFFPDNTRLSVLENKASRHSSQQTFHLLLTDSQGFVEPATTLRILYPKGKAVILLMRQLNQTFPAGADGDKAVINAYRHQEELTKHLMTELRVPDERLLSEQWMLWQLRRIFKENVFTHRVN